MMIRTRLWIVNALVIITLTAIAFVTNFSIGNIRELNEISAQGLKLKGEFLLFASSGKDLLSTSNLGSVLETWRVDYDRFLAANDAFTTSAKLIKLLRAAERSSHLDSYTFLWDATKKSVDDIFSGGAALVAKHKEEGFNVQGFLYGYEVYGDSDFVPLIAKVNTLTISINTGLVPRLERLIEGTEAAVQSAENTLSLILLGLATFTVVLVVLLLALFSGSLRRRLSNITLAMETLKHRDYTKKAIVKGKDEIAGMTRMLNGFIDDLSSIIAGVKRLSASASNLKNEVTSATVQSSAAVTEMTASIAAIATRINDFVDNLSRANHAVSEIFQGIDSLDGRIQAQATFVTQSSASIEEMNASIASIAGIAEKRVSAAEKLVQITREGGEVIDQTNASVDAIAKDIGEIGQIVGIINGIAGQTNLLSMNAAIEAAHAGNSGRGFAVVAEEIRKLADSTNQNAKRVKAMVQGISQRIIGVTGQSAKSKQAFAAVDTEVLSTSKALEEISFSMKELSQGSHEMMNSMTRLSEIAQNLETDADVMKKHASEVSSGMGNLDNAAEMVRNGMTEIEIGTKDINAAMVHVSELQLQSAEAIGKLAEEVSIFKTAD